MSSGTTATTLIAPTFTSLGVQTTASIGGTYIPPFASYATASADGIADATATTTANDPNPTTPAFLNDYDWINSYLTIHTMSAASYRYAYLLWLAISFVIVFFAFLHLSGGRGGAWGARWAKFALRRRTWRKKSSRMSNAHQQPWSLPSNAQILSLVWLFVVPAILCTVGSDYIAPGTGVWDLTHNLTRRHLPEIDLDELFRRGPPIASTATTRPPDFTIAKEWWTAGGRTGVIAFSLFPLVILFSLKAPPFALLAIPFTLQIHFDKLARLHRWTGRIIWLISAVHVGTWSVQLDRDERHGHKGHAWKFVWVYHKFIYGMVAFGALTLLTLLSIGPIRKRFYEFFYISHIILVPTTLVFSALHFPPIWWWCWAPLFLWFLERTYRMIHFLYLNDILGSSGARRTATAFAYPDEEPLEKVAAGGYAAAKLFDSTATPLRRLHHPEAWEMDVRGAGGKSFDGHARFPSDTSMLDAGRERVTSYESGEKDRDSGATDETTGEWSRGTAVDHRSSDSYCLPPPPMRFPAHVPPLSKNPSYSTTYTQPAPAMPSSLSHLNFPAMHPLASILAAPSSQVSRLPPPGYARAILLPGRTIRISLITARRFTWSPGQHVLLTIPSISRFGSHPFTVASVSDTAIAGSHGREMVLVVRVKRGFTNHLWEKVKEATKEKRTSLELDGKQAKNGKVPPAMGGEHDDPENGSGPVAQQATGVTFRAWVDGPFGSSIRAHWGSHSSVVIICGGSGVSFGTSILEYLCLCLNGRDGRSLGGKSGGVGKDSFVTRRVRFVWVVREYSHIQWCAPILRRCIDMMPNTSILQVDIFVTNFSGGKSGDTRSQALHSVYGADNGVDDPLAPPAPHFAREGRLDRRMSVSSDDSNDSHASSNSMAELHYANGGRYDPNSRDMADDSDDGHVLDFTNFDGDDDTHAPGEAQLSLKVKKEGRLRRAASRKVATATQAKMELSQKVAAQGGQDEAGTSTARIVPQSVYRSPTKARNWEPTDALLSPTLQRGVSLFDPPLSPSSHDMVNSAPKWGMTRDVTPRPEDFAAPTSPTSLHGRNYSGNLDNRMSVADSLQDRLPSPSPSGAGGLPHETMFDNRSTLAGSESFRHLMATPQHAAGGMDTALYTPGMLNVGDDVILEYDEEELDDLNAVSEMARPGKPKLDKILKDEVERSRGAVAVACCGPTSLNALTRKLVAALIDPARIERGDLRGQITLTSEEFEW